MLLFWADWDDNSELLRKKMEIMTKKYKNLRFAYTDFEESELTSILDIEIVQTIVVLHPYNSGYETIKKVGITTL